MAFGSTAFWGVIVPQAGVNLLENPSGEKGTYGWGTLTGGTVGTSSTEQQFGAWSGSIAPTSATNAGAFFGTFQSGAGTVYSLSAYVLGQPGIIYSLQITDTSDSAIQQFINFTGGGTWQRIGTWYSEASGGARRLAVRKSSSNNTGVIYVDGCMVGLGSASETYIDGDQEGCYWLGAPHQSQSARDSQSRAGGSIVALADLGFTPEQELGVAMPPLENTAQSFALQPGGEFQRQRAAARPFTLTARVDGTTWRDFHIQRRKVINALKIDAVGIQQPTRFWYVGGEGTVQIDAVMDGGMEGGGNDGFGEHYGVRFIAYDPYWSATTQEGTALAPRVALGSANFMVKRDSLGRWGTMGANGTTVQGASIIYDLLYSGGTVFLCGSFGTLGGTAYPHVGMYFPSSNTFGTLAGGTLGLDARSGAAVRKFALSPAGSLFMVGAVANVGGTATRGVVQWNGAWGTLTNGTVDNPSSGGSGANWISHIAGTLFVGGFFLGAGGTSSPNITRWVNGAWGSLVGGTVDASVAAIQRGGDNRIYVGGAFNVAAGTAANGIAVWSGSTWGTMGHGNNGTLVNTLGLELNGKIIMGGQFSATGDGQSAYAVAEWNGVGWSALGSGLQNQVLNTGAAIRTLVDNTTGDVLVCGGFKFAGGRQMPDSIARWNGYAWLPLDLDLIASASGSVWSMAQGPDNSLYIAGTWTGTARAASVAQVVNTGAAEVYPTLYIRNPSSGTARVYQLVNTLTDDGIYFNYVMQPGEEATLNLRPGSRTFTSTYVGNLFPKIVGGSNLATWRLLPGTNWVSFFADNDSLVTSIYWRPRNWSADGTVV